jgi:predicted MFS family arabinose efflux permease
MATVDPPRTPNIPPEIVPLRARQVRIPKTFAALRHRNYQLFLGGQLISLAGTWMQIIAQGWLVYQISGSELALGVAGFASAIPVLVLSPFAGVLADRINKRTLMVTTQICAMILALVLAALAFTGTVQVWHIVLLAGALGVVNAFDGPTRQAFVVEMVGRDDLPNAIALNSMTFNTGRIIGPAIGGLVLASLGAGWCFLLNGVTFLAVIIGLVAMRLPPHQPKMDQPSPWEQMVTGLSYVQHQPQLRALLILALSFSLFGISYSTVLPAFIDKALGKDATAFGTINAMSGIGAVAAAFMIARWGSGGYRGEWLYWGILGFPIVLVAFALVRFYPLSLILAVLLGIGFMTTFTLINTLLQTNVADEMRGRVLSLYTLTFFGFAPFGNLAVGSVSEWIGITQTFVISAALCFVSAFLILTLVPSVRRLP